MCRTFSESKSGSYAGRIAPPGIPNTTSAPTRSSDRTRDCAPVSSSALSFSDISGLLALTIPPGIRCGCYACTPQVPHQQKTPAAGWQTRERVDELSSADTLTYDENGPCAHAATIPPRSQSQFSVGMRLAIRKDAP